LPPLKLGHSVCAMKADEGPCKAIHMRYYFNIQSRECEIFEYGGCHGNENNFLTLEECQKKCVVTGHYRFILQTSSSSIVVLECVWIFFFPHPVHHLPLFVEKPDFCFHEKDPGICRGYLSRYFYNKETKLCEVFKYGGCLGNQNNFKNLEECQTTCQGNCFCVLYDLNEILKSTYIKNLSINLKLLESHTPVSSKTEYKPPPIPSLCMTPMDRGLCRAKELRFFYNFSTGRCHTFSYSGCGGNENNFTSRKSCLRICKK
ncbi:TFPI1 inhibitor, partial [Probosciger aterrimus]|nr:TFPI1 inhibitor [Probosciger aterrimus]